MLINDARIAKFRRVAQARQGGLTVILENVVDQHNIGAVLRSCDSVGIQEVFVLYSQPGIRQKNIELGRRTAAGAQKWMDIHFFDEVEPCFELVRSRYERVYATHLSEQAVSLYELDLCESVALLFGNELKGLSAQSLPFVDGNFVIPQVGMAESLNISVACALSVYEAYRQRNARGWYAEANPYAATERDALFEQYVNRHELAVQQRQRKPGINPDSIING